MVSTTSGRSCPPQGVIVDRRAEGEIRLSSPESLGPVAPRLGAWLHRWAGEAPGRVAVAERSGGGWREVTYLELLEAVRAVAGALLARGYGPGSRVAFLSGNGVDHLILAHAAMYVGAAVVPLAEQYALLPEAEDRLLFTLRKAGPRMVFAYDAGRLARALAMPALDGIEVVAVRTEGAPRAVTPFSALLAGAPGGDVDAAHAAVGHDTIAKILFTSGSSSDPKAVITTHGMMTTNQAQIAAAWTFLAQRPPKILDWLPWNHVFGGSKTANLVLCHGGSLYIDSGKPTAAAFGDTVANIMDHAGTLSFNVPVGYAMLVDAAEKDRALRRRFFADLDLLFYAGASLAQPIWERLERWSLEEGGRLPLMASSWGMTETSPACLMVHEPVDRAGRIGVPLPRTEARLLPAGDAGRFELRVRGPNVTPGYLDDPERTAAAFDEEGFLVTGDAVRFADPAEPDRGLVFDGRVTEDFKLSSGTWVNAGRIRLDALKALDGLASEIVVCGHDRPEIGLFIFPDRARPRQGDESEGTVTDPGLLSEIAERLAALNLHATGSARRIARAIVLAEPPSVAGQEITDKGSLNVRRVLTRRAELLDRLYTGTAAGLVRP